MSKTIKRYRIKLNLWIGGHEYWIEILEGRKYILSALLFIDNLVTLVCFFDTEMIIILNYNFPFIILLLLLKAGVVPWYLNLSWLIYVLGYLVLTARLRSLVLQEMKTLIAVTPFSIQCLLNQIREEPQRRNYARK